MTRWLVLIVRFIRGIWFRTVMFTLGAVLLAVAAHYVSRLIPDSWVIDFGQGSVETILQILASSMLAVTTFSLSVMVSTFASAAAAATPRSGQLLFSDRTSQNTLSTFIGSFAFSIISIIALSAEVYSQAGKTMLFLATLGVVVMIMVALLNWISFLITFGSMPDILDRIEKTTVHAMRKYAADPRNGAAEWSNPPEDAVKIYPDMAGYITEIDVHALNRIALAADAEIFLPSRSGSRATPGTVLAYVNKPVPKRVITEIQQAVVIENHREYDQDPRLGVIAFSEIASRSLASGGNDPGTVVAVLGALERVLAVAMKADFSAPVRFPKVHLPVISPEDFVVDAFRPISRDGAPMIELTIRLLKEIRMLMNSANEPWKKALSNMAASAHSRSLRTLEDEQDRAEISALYEELGFS